jgi:uncharacterized protein YjbI with pentapeptide repeats
MQGISATARPGSLRNSPTVRKFWKTLAFVRQLAVENAAVKPLNALNLRDADLPGLDLACEDTDRSETCAKLFGANLTGAYLTGAYLFQAHLTART